MDFQWIAIALGDVVWISIAFVLGLLSRAAGLPPLVGFLATGFLLNAYGIASGEMLKGTSKNGRNVARVRSLVATVPWPCDSRSLLIG